MVGRKPVQSMLFDMAAEPAITGKPLLHVDADVCPHICEEPTVTVWPGTLDERMTATCRSCGRVRGVCSYTHVRV